MHPELDVEVRNRVAHVTLNRPHTLNVLSFGMVRELARLFGDWQEDDAVNAIVVRGAGEKAFCAGGDVRSICEMFKAGDPDYLNFFIEEYRLDFLIHRYPKPCVALMDGIVMGGGMGIAQGMRTRIVTDRTRMSMPETLIGLFPDVGASYFLSRLEGALGAYLGVSGKELRAPDILEAGLGDVYLDAQALAQLDAALADIVWSDDPERDIEAAIGGLRCRPRSDPALEPYWDVIDDHFGEPTVPAIIAALRAEERSAFVDWARQTADSLAARSPTMMSVTLAQLQRAKRLSLADCFRMELDLIHASFRHGDFIEGVRARLIDKDNAPRWNPPTLDAVAPETVTGFFQSPWTKDAHPLAALHP